MVKDLEALDREIAKERGKISGLDAEIGVCEKSIREQEKALTLLKRRMEAYKKERASRKNHLIECLDAQVSAYKKAQYG